MKKVYVAVYQLEESLEVLGVFSNRADAEEWCMQDFEDTLYESFNHYVNIYGDTAKEAITNTDEEWLRYGYKVRETVYFD